YRNHALHQGERAWLETNCYVDLWIEVLHAYGLEPNALMAFTLASDFEGDQWLFFKPPTRDLYELYGVDVQELNIWRGLIDHLSVQLSRGRLVLVEVDAYYLPDTAGVSYRAQHTKTTIAVETLDADERRLGYFHNAGYFTLSGDDYDGLFGALSAGPLVPYTEFARIDPARALRGAELAQASRGLLKGHVARMPRDNPIPLLAAGFERELGRLRDAPQEAFHVYAFATLRQCGAGYELAASYLRWLSEQGVHDLLPAIEACDALSSQAKLLQFKAARAAVLKKPVEFAPMFEAMGRAWSGARECLTKWAE
ncbi:MAG TPA: DUF1839 family protein, partial [Polyangiales bacterium]